MSVQMEVDDVFLGPTQRDTILVFMCTLKLFTNVLYTAYSAYYTAYYFLKTSSQWPPKYLDLIKNGHINQIQYMFVFFNM